MHFKLKSDETKSATSAIRILIAYVPSKPTSKPTSKPEEKKKQLLEFILLS